MSKFISVVKFKVKIEEESNFIESMQKFKLPDGLVYRKLIKTGDSVYCSIIEWANEEALENFIRSIQLSFNNRDSSNCYF